MENLCIFDIERFAIHDGPGIRTLVFTKGCPLSCLWCCNPEGQKREPEVWVLKQRCVSCGTCIGVCPENAIFRDENGIVRTDRDKCKNCGQCFSACPQYARRWIGEVRTTQEVLRETLKDLDVYRYSGGGVTIGGGEPIVQAGGVRELVWKCKQYGLNIGIETSGYGKWEDLDSLTDSLDFVLYDIKHMDSEAHRKFTGVTNDLIRMNAERLSRKGVPLVISFPLIPTLNDSEENTVATARFVSKLDSMGRVRVLPYFRSGISKYHSLEREYFDPELKPPIDSQVQNVKGIFESYGLKVDVGY